jgi:hypothetical protein
MAVPTFAAFASVTENSRTDASGQVQSIALITSDGEDFPLPATFPAHRQGMVAESVVSQKDTSAHRQEADTVLRFIESYDIAKHRVYPMPPRVFAPDEELDYPEMNPLFLPLIFSPKRSQFSLKDVHSQKMLRSVYVLPVRKNESLLSFCEAERFVNRLTQEIVQQMVVNNIREVRYDQSTLPQPEKLVYIPEKKPTVLARPAVPAPPKANTKILPVLEASPWRRLGNSKFQLTQTYVSPNWSKGGESNMAGLASLYLEADYSDTKNFVFENFVDIKIGMNTVSTDTLRNLNVSTDQLRAVSKMGLRMYNDLYYSLSAEFSTQFLNNYKANTWNLRSSFLSPAKLFVGLGIDYKKTDRKKGYNLSVLVTPLTVKMNYVLDNEKISPVSYGIDKGKHFKKELGGKVSANLTYAFSDQVKWTSKIYYYTDFSYVDSDWENTLDLILNTYFTTSLYVHLKLDDRLKRDPGESLLQTQELFSFGMMYRW